MFTFYSLSKPFCVIGLMKLKDKGLVDIDAHPSRYVPEMKGFDKRVTIKQMLHHISGLPDFEQNTDFAQKYAPGYARYAREHLTYLADYPQYFAPGTNEKYANVNMVVCALIIENVTSLSYAEYMKKEVFEPLGMRSAVVDNENLIIKDRVEGYELINCVIAKCEKSHNWLLGAGDIVGTVDDVYALNKAIKHRLMLKESTWQEILTPSPLNNMGMGCAVFKWHGKRRITHNGGHKGFRTMHVQLPEDDLDIIFLSNSGYGEAREHLAEMIYSAFYGDNQTAEKTAQKMDMGYI
jgi:CubicO group peptidase (beta-lactamase class C family)